jgi:Icc-related predicted phosphoesterase
MLRDWKECSRSHALKQGVFLLIGALAVAGCPKSDEAKKAQANLKAKTETAEKSKPADTAPTGPVTSDPECIAAFTSEGAPQKIDINGKSYELKGAKLQETSTDADDEAVIGVVSTIKEDTPENLKNLKAIADFFKAEKAETIVVAGDLGDTEIQIVNVLEPLAATGLPVFAIIGNQEKKSEFNGALKASAAKHNNVFNLNLVRLVQLDDVAFVSLPGYFNKDYIHVESGCHYLPSDVEATKAIIKAAGDKPVVVVSHGPPKQDGPEAIDRTLEQANVGDPALTRLLQETGVKFGIFENIREAGGRATDLSGTALVAPGKMVSELYLNPGPADNVRWTMNDRTESVGMAAILQVKGKQAAFKTFRIKADGK